MYVIPAKPGKTTGYGAKNVLECRVCDLAFGSQGDQTPRLLMCGHTLCHCCLTKLQANRTDNLILCPFDRQATSLGMNGVFDLKKNFALIELMEKADDSDCGSFTLPGVEDGVSGSDLSQIVCDEDESHVASVYCTVCGSHLCESCSYSSHASRSLMSHKRVPISQKPKEKPKCPYHSAHVMEFVCLEAECGHAPLMCYICKDYSRHKGHAHSLLDVEADKMKNVIGVAISSIRRFMEDLAESSAKLESFKTRIAGHQHALGTAEQAKLRVRAYFQTLREQLNMQENAAITVVDTYCREKLYNLCQLQEEAGLMLSHVGAVLGHCERVARQDDARIVLAANEIKQMLQTMDLQRQHFTHLSLDTTLQHLDTSIPITFTKDNRVHIGPKIEMRVVTLGLDGSGKTSILFKMKHDEFVQTIPTIGFNVEALEYKNIKFTIWDVGGQPKLRPLWKHYYINTQAVIFVIDSSNREQLSEARDELVKLLGEKELQDACLLVLANKQDVAGCMSGEEISDKLSLHKLCCGRCWHLIGCDASAGSGLNEVLDWLARQLVASGISDFTPE